MVPPPVLVCVGVEMVLAQMPCGQVDEWLQPHSRPAVVLVVVEAAAGGKAQPQQVVSPVEATAPAVPAVAAAPAEQATAAGSRRHLCAPLHSDSATQRAAV